jgi:DNA-binding winged helix-turn-helix (wHTH) protein
VRIRFGRFVFDDRLHELQRDGVRVDLSPKAFALLQRLIETRPAAQTRESLYEHLWPATFVEPGNLHTLISEIRTALRDEKHMVIRTIHRVGYAFAAEDSANEESRFVVSAGSRDYPLRPGENWIGRDPDCTVPIDAPEVSRHHASIVVQGDALTLHDAGSKNGTFVGSARITEPLRIHAGETIVIASITLHVRERNALLPTKTAG